MTDSRASVQHALDRVNAARPYERPSRLRELMVAGTALQDETEVLHGWLQRADEYLTKNPDHKEFHAREERYLGELQRYTESHNLLGKALLVIGGKSS